MIGFIQKEFIKKKLCRFSKKLCVMCIQKYFLSSYNQYEGGFHVYQCGFLVDKELNEIKWKFYLVLWISLSILFP